jgi:hypothetical protein
MDITDAVAVRRFMAIQGAPARFQLDQHSKPRCPHVFVI